MEAYDQAGTRLAGRFGDWEEVCWGDPKRGALGRIPMSLLLARTIHTHWIIWSTGCSRERDECFESEYMYKRALASYASLLHDFPDRFRRDLLGNETDYRLWLKQCSVIDTDSHNTATSMTKAKTLAHELCKANDSLVYSVSSANHAPRVLRDACVAFDIGTGVRSHSSGASHALVAVPAETNYGTKTISETIVRDLGD
jgi:hypothetical protein